MNQIMFIGLIALTMMSCGSKQEFNSEEWKQKGLDWWMTDTREKMIDDLTQSDTLIGLTQEQVIDLLGKPESQDDSAMKYLIREKYGTDIDPEYISNLIVELDDKGKVRICRIDKNP